MIRNKHLRDFNAAIKGNGIVIAAKRRFPSGDLIEGNAFSLSWDTIWYGRTTIDEGGWTAEIKIPYQSLNYDPDGETWGLNFSRGLRRNNEESRWADPYPQRFLSDFYYAGVLSNMRHPRAGIGLDVTPGFTLGYLEDPDVDEDIQPSGDIFYKVLPSLTISATANTTFGETEADQRRVNLSRFAIAFPEKRDFFLQDALIFEFAEMTDDFSGLPENGQPFFSRTIGISRPDPSQDLFEPVDILAGGKVTGRVGPVKLGVLHTLVDDVGSVDRQQLTVARAATNLLESSTLGIIATHGDPLGQIDNSLVGTDFVYRKRDLFGDKNLVGIAWYQQSFTSGVDGDPDQQYDGRENAFGGSLSYPNDIYNWAVSYRDLGRSYQPAMGFVNRRQIRHYEGHFRYRTRLPGYIRTIDHEVSGEITTDHDDQVESSRAQLQVFQIENDVAGRIELNVRHRYERPISDFQLPGNVRIDARGYNWIDGMARVSMSRNRDLWPELTLAGGQYYDGTWLIAISRTEWRPSPHFLLGLDYELRKIDVPVSSDPTSPTGTVGGTATKHLARARVGFFFTPDISWKTLFQWDNATNSVDVNSRLRWIVEDGREIFVVLNQGYRTRRDRIINGDGLGDDTPAHVGLYGRRTEAIIKVGWNFRF